MRDDQIRYEALRRRVARRVRRRLWRSLLWHTGLFILLNGVAWALMIGRAGVGGYILIGLTALWLLALLIHFVVFIGNWVTDLMRESENWREIERMVDRDEDDSWVREREKVKRDFARLSDDGELEYYEDDALYHKRRADAE
jgi:hypothetical protein